MSEPRDDLAILVVTEILGDAELVQRLLSFEFGNVRISTDPLRCVEEFEAAAPEVLVLAFNSLEKAEEYHLELQAQSALARRGLHRTLVLCTREEVRHAYDLCKLGMFDDYVLFWPLTHDTPRLLLAVRHAMKHLPARGAPAVDAQAEEPVERADEPAVPAGQDTGGTDTATRRPLVLVVDDDPFQHRLFESMLGDEPIELQFATSAQHGLELMHHRSPAAVLMDINMPEVDGVEATRRIKSVHRFQPIPVIMVTGLGTRDRVVESRQAGASEFLVKPVNRDALLAKLRKVGVLPS